MAAFTDTFIRRPVLAIVISSLLLLLGSTAQRIMVALNTDVLVVRAKGTNN